MGGPSRGLLSDCETKIFAKVRCSSSGHWRVEISGSDQRLGDGATMKTCLRTSPAPRPVPDNISERIMKRNVGPFEMSCSNPF